MANNFGIPEVTTSQSQKEGRVNDAFDKIIKAFSKQLEKSVAAGGTIALTNEESLLNGVLKFTGAPAAALTVTVPAVQKLYVCLNATSPLRNITVKTPSGTGITITSATARILYCDGTNVIAIV